ncbi:P-loop containing nucleoside triphosphate hydrolase protein [Lactarius akahatsu]|uniref:Kinesin-like protein n=1 Tax=Lactarius akahatsu TaxID=416441 RepID=A0AAD4LQH7_9AGAM|nr:P-loop containing nucleoside triphosphate hydrolase protein [Lactarius akahatsu]
MANVQTVKIVARLRPPIPGELSDQGIRIVTTDDENDFPAICVNNPRDQSQVFKFPFSSCYGHDSRQEDIFKADVRPLIEIVYSGATATIFAYGVTSSGKTHTMQGTRSQPGVIPRAVEALFEYRQTCKDDASLSVSYMEIYRDEVYDLLVDRETAPKLPVRENDAGQVFVANLSSVPIQDVSDFNKLYTIANKQRSVGSTLLNRASSRSHAILTLEVKLTRQDKILTGKMNLVDLAGSENNKLTGNDTSRLQESAAINKSLSVLGQVVHALNTGASRIPYRNSKLTRILQDALGGSSVGLLICNLAPGLKFRQDTLNTLNFAVRTRNVENKPVINEHEAQPAPKLHFSATRPAPPKLAPLTTAPIAGPSEAPSIVPRSVPSRVTGAAGPSRVPRKSAAFHMAEAAPYPNTGKRRESGIGFVRERYNLNKGLTDQDIDDKISKAVEAEVERRLKEKLDEIERQRVAEEERARKEAEIADSTKDQSLEIGQRSLPPGLLTPLLKRHQDLDNELRQRLQELEKKYDHGRRDGDAVHKLSPMSRKKTGRAYVALARSHSEKGDLQIALDLYRKAESYVPDNIKLKERIREIEWAVSHGTVFQPSPKRTRTRKRARRTTQARVVKFALSTVPEKSTSNAESDEEVVISLLGDESTVDLPERGKGVARAKFGVELTNSPTKLGTAEATRPGRECGDASCTTAGSA